MSTKPTLPTSARQTKNVHRTTRDLTAAQRLLVQLMSDHQFGRVENMSVREGQPILDHDVKVVRVSRLSGDAGPTDAISAREFELKRAIRDLFGELERLENGLVIRLEFRHGLPILLELAERKPASSLAES